jgi:hypothetical protein
LVFHQLTHQLRALQKDRPWWQPFRRWMEEPTSRLWVQYWATRVFDHFNPASAPAAAIESPSWKEGETMGLAQFEAFVSAQTAPVPAPGLEEVLEKAQAGRRKNAFLDRIDRFMVGRRGLEAVELDRSFLQAAARGGFFSRTWTVDPVLVRGDDRSSNVAYAILSPLKSTIKMANVPGGRLEGIAKSSTAFSRWLTLAHEAGHCELESQDRYFRHPTLPYAQQDAIEQLLFSSPQQNALKSVFHEMVADAMAVVTTSRMSGFDPALAPEFSSVIQERRTSVEKTDRDWADFHKKAGESPSVLGVFENHPHRTARVIEDILDRVQEWRHLPPAELFGWVQQQVSAHWLTMVVACGKPLHDELDNVLYYQATDGLWTGATNIINTLLLDRLEGTGKLSLQGLIGPYAGSPLGAFLVEHEATLHHLVDEARLNHPGDWATLCALPGHPQGERVLPEVTNARHQALCNIADETFHRLLDEAATRHRTGMEVLGDLQARTLQQAGHLIADLREAHTVQQGPSAEEVRDSLVRRRTLSELRPKTEPVLVR